jgi:hypothetical protein
MSWKPIWFRATQDYWDQSYRTNRRTRRFLAVESLEERTNMAIESLGETVVDSELPVEMIVPICSANPLEVRSQNIASAVMDSSTGAPFTDQDIRCDTPYAEEGDDSQAETRRPEDMPVLVDPESSASGQGSPLGATEPTETIGGSIAAPPEEDGLRSNGPVEVPTPTESGRSPSNSAIVPSLISVAPLAIPPVTPPFGTWYSFPEPLTLNDISGWSAECWEQVDSIALEAPSMSDDRLPTRESAINSFVANSSATTLAPNELLMPIVSLQSPAKKTKGTATVVLASSPGPEQINLSNEVEAQSREDVAGSADLDGIADRLEDVQFSSPYVFFALVGLYTVPKLLANRQNPADGLRDIKSRRLPLQIEPVEPT